MNSITCVVCVGYYISNNANFKSIPQRFMSSYTPHSRRIQFQKKIFAMNNFSQPPPLRRAPSTPSSSATSTTSPTSSSVATTTAGATTSTSTATGTSSTRHGILKRSVPDICTVCNVRHDVLNCPVRRARLAIHQSLRDAYTQTEYCTCANCITPTDIIQPPSPQPSSSRDYVEPSPPRQPAPSPMLIAAATHRPKPSFADVQPLHQRYVKLLRLMTQKRNLTYNLENRLGIGYTTFKESRYITELRIVNENAYNEIYDSLAATARPTLSKLNKRCKIEFNSPENEQAIRESRERGRLL